MLIRYLACVMAASATLLAGGCSGATTGASPAPVRAVAGHLVVVGGGPIPPEVTRRFVDLAGGPGKARIAVLPMASAVATTGSAKVAELRGLGADAFVLDVKRVDADSDSVVAKLAAVTGVWFPGGDQNRIMTAIGGSRTARAIIDRYTRGAVVGGTSAGAAVMSSMMITGDEKKVGGTRPPTDSSQAYITIDRDNIVTTAGLGMIDDAIVDQHFVRRRRLNRLISLVLEHPRMLGAGIDESTAIVVRPDGTWEIIGASVVLIFDARNARITAGTAVLGGAGTVMHVLPAGSLFDPGSGRVIRLGSPLP